MHFAGQFLQGPRHCACVETCKPETISSTSSKSDFNTTHSLPCLVELAIRQLLPLVPMPASERDPPRPNPACSADHGKDNGIHEGAGGRT